MQLASLVDEARAAGFVGRADQLAAFDAALAGSARQRVLFVHGPGGIGKTTLLHQLRMRTVAAGRRPLVLDGREVAASPEQFTAALSRASGRGAGAERAAPWDAVPPDAVLMVDSYEQLAPLDGWLRNTFLPELEAGVIVVLLGRSAPDPAWRTDPGWRSVVAVHALQALPDDDSVELLARAQVPAPLRHQIAGLGRGHPLTLALLADVTATGAVPASLADAPDLVASLAAEIVDVAPDTAHARGLALCALAWTTTRDLLGDAVGNRADEVWAWLDARPFVSRGPFGLYPHDLVRDVLEADVRRRVPDLYRDVHRILHDRAVRGLREGDSVERQLWAHQKLFLHRGSPMASSFWAMRSGGVAAAVPGRAEDHPAVLELVERAEGSPGAELAARWLDAQPENLFVVRSADGLSAYCFHAVYPADATLCAADPVVAGIVDRVSRTSPIRPGEQVSIGRFFGDAHAKQRSAHAVIAGAVSSTVLWVTRPLAWSVVATSDTEFWGPVLDYLALTTRFTVELDDRTITAFAIDWRRLPVDAWFELMKEREITGETGPAPAHLVRPAPLSRERFAVAVRGALRDLHRPDRLHACELAGSRLAVDTRGASSERLCEVLLAAVERVGAGAKAESLHRVLDRTYVRPAPTQEAAAEVLGLPFSTYRRHHDRALERLTDILWAAEIGEIRLDGPPA